MIYTKKIIYKPIFICEKTLISSVNQLFVFMIHQAIILHVLSILRGS